MRERKRKKMEKYIKNKQMNQMTSVKNDAQKTNDSPSNNDGGGKEEICPHLTPDATSKRHDIKVATVNARSLTNKLEDLINQFRSRQADIVFVSETWDRGQLGIEEVEQLHNLSWTRCNRSSLGGGSAVVVSRSSFDVKPLKIKVPELLEIAWIQAVPKWDPKLKILLGGFYSSSGVKYKPPKGLLEDHVFDVIYNFMTDNMEGKVILGGDVNADSLKLVLSLPGFKSHIEQPTRGDAFLDIVVSNFECTSSKVFPPLSPDDQGESSSDHGIAFATLLSPPPLTKHWMTLKRRKYSKHAERGFVDAMGAIDWRILETFADVDQMEMFFSSKMAALYDKFFPYKKTSVRVNEPAYFSEHIRNLHREQRRLYSSGNSLRYWAARKKF